MTGGGHIGSTHTSKCFSRTYLNDDVKKCHVTTSFIASQEQINNNDTVGSRSDVHTVTGAAATKGTGPPTFKLRDH